MKLHETVMMRLRGTRSTRGAGVVSLVRPILSIGAIITVVGLASQSCWASMAGDLDTSFGSGGSVVTNSPTGFEFAGPGTLLHQPDGKLVFSASDKQSNLVLVRYTANGSLDFIRTIPGINITTNIGRQSTGALVFGGTTLVGSSRHAAVFRLTSDGDVDTIFGSSGVSAAGVDLKHCGFHSRPYDEFVCDLFTRIIVMPDDSLVVVGSESLPHQPPAFLLAQLPADGTTISKTRSPFPSGISGAFAVARQSDGKLILGGEVGADPASYGTPSQFALARYTAGGNVDSSFGDSGEVVTKIGYRARITDLVIQDDGKLIAVGGGGGNAKYEGQTALARYNSDGSLDASYGNGGVARTFATPPVFPAHSAFLQNDGKLVVAAKGDLLRYRVDGSLDPTFADNGVRYTTLLNNSGGGTAVAQSDAQLIVAGTAFTSGFVTDIFVGRYFGSVCGNSNIDPGESCDDGNFAPEDGCNTDCVVEACALCTGLSCAPLATGTACPDDGSPCTLDQCDGAHTTCQHPPAPGTDGDACDDHNPCSGPDICSVGHCGGPDTCAGAWCPGTPDPCVVTGTFSVPPTTIDLGGRALHLTGSARFNIATQANVDESFTIQGASSIVLDKGAVISATGPGVADTPVELDSAGACTIDGKIQSDGAADTVTGAGADGGDITLSCASIDLGSKARVEANGAGNLLISEGVDAGAGGNIAFRANAGPLTVESGATLSLIGAGELGGNLIAASTSMCTFGGVVYADGKNNPAYGNSGDGGSMTFTCDGIELSHTANLQANGQSIVTADDAGFKSVEGGNGGTVTLNAGAGALTVDQGAKLNLLGRAAAGGQLQASASGPCRFAGVLKANATSVTVAGNDPEGGDAGSVSFVCSGGVSIAEKAALTTGTVRDAAAGAVTLQATDGAVSIGKGARFVDHGISGQIAITAHDACIVSGSLQSRSLDSTAAAVAVDCNTVSFDSTSKVLLNNKGGDVGPTLNVTVVGACNFGGSVTLVGAGDSVDGQALPGNGGMFEATCPAGISTAGHIDVSGEGSDGSGGFISLSASGPVSMSGKLQANGVSAGDVSAEGCDVTLNSGSTILATGGAGTATLVAHDNLTVQGTITTGKSSAPGTIDLRYRNTGSVANPNKLRPPTSGQQDLSLTPCQ